MQKLYIVLIALLFSSNSFAQCAMATANNSFGVFCDTSGDIDVQAAQYCEKSGGHNCLVIAHFSNSCWAIAKDKSLGISAEAHGYSTLNEAKLASINKCLTQGGKSCSNTSNVGCEGSTQINNLQPPKTQTQLDPVVKNIEVNCEGIDGWWSRFKCRNEKNKKKIEEDRLEKQRLSCDTFGFKRDTIEHAQCMLQLHAQAQANARAAATKSDQDLQDLLKPRHQSDDLKPDVINNGPSTPLFDFNPKMHRSCTSSVNGNQVYTTCN